MNEKINLNTFSRWNDFKEGEIPITYASIPPTNHAPQEFPWTGLSLGRNI